MTDNIYVERINNALRVIRGVQDESFNLNAWPYCVLGHCATDVWFKSQGLRASRSSIPSFANEDGLEAGARLFGISHEVAERLFLTGNWETGAYYGNATRKAVLAHLEVLKMKKLAEIETGRTVEVRDFEAVKA